jgi:hypothetical protein
MFPGGPRLALRRRRIAVFALLASITLVLSCLGIESASASAKSRLDVSLNPDRSSALRLDRSTVKGRSTSSSGLRGPSTRSTSIWTTRKRRTRPSKPTRAHRSTSQVALATARHCRTTPRNWPTDRTASESC